MARHVGLYLALAVAMPMRLSAMDPPSEGRGADNYPDLIIQVGHRTPVLDARVSDSGKILLTGGNDNTARLWDVRTGDEIRVLRRHAAGVGAVALSPDSRLALTGGDISGVLWDTSSGEVRHRLTGHKAMVTDVDWSADGKYFATASADDQTARVYDARTRDLIGLLEFGSHIRKIRFCASGRYLVVIGGRVGVWEMPGATPVEFPGLPSIEKAIDAAVVDDVLFVVSGGRGSATLRAVGGDAVTWKALDNATCWDYAPEAGLVAAANHRGEIELRSAEGEIVGRRRLENQPIHNLSFSRSGHRLIASTIGGTLYLFDSGNMEVVSTFTGGWQWPLGLASLKGADSWAISGGEAVMIWPTVGGGRRTFRLDEQVSALATDDRSTYLAVGGAGGRVRVFDLLNGSPVLDQPKVFRRPVTALAFSKAGERLVAAAEGDRLAKFERAGRGWDFVVDDQEVGYRVALDRHGDRVGWPTSGREGGLVVRDLAGAMQSRRIRHPEGQIATRLCFAGDGSRLAMATSGEVGVWTLDPPEIEHRKRFPAGYLKYFEVSCLEFDGGGGRLAFGTTTGAVYVWDLASHEIVKRENLMSASILSIEFDEERNCLLVSSIEGPTAVLGLPDLRPLCLLLQHGDGAHWVATTRDGSVDCDDLDEIASFRWTFPDDPLRPLPPEIFLRDFFEPRLLPRLLAGERLPEPARPLAELNRVQPAVDDPAVRVEGDTAYVTVRVRAASNRDTFGVGARAREMTTAAYDLRLLRDGQLVWQYPSSDRDPNQDLAIRTEAQMKSWRDAYPIEPNRPDGWHEETVPVLLPGNRAAGEPVRFEAYCFNEDRVKSRTAAASVLMPAGLVPIKPKAFVICVGANACQTRDLDLRFAAEDARDVGKRLGEALRGYEVVPVTLVSDYEEPRHEGRVTVADATKGNLRAVLAQLSGGEVPAEALERLPGPARHLPRSGPDDLVVLYAAGHGYTDPADGMFYLLTYDVGDHRDALRGDDTRARQAAFRDIFRASVSSSELSRWLRGVDAAQHVLVLDTCMSQGAVESAASEFKPGPFGSRGLGQLAYDKAMLVLAASQTDEFAVGLGALKHGLLTYTLLEGLGYAGERPRPRVDPASGRLTLAGLLKYAADEVPEVYKMAKEGRLEARGVALAAEPWAGGTLGVLERRWPSLGGGGGPGAQRPVLFDYRQGRPDVLLAEAKP